MAPTKPSKSMDRQLGRHKNPENSVKREVLPKDATELQLEKALFGDEAGFLNSLQTSNSETPLQLARTEDIEKEKESNEGELDGVADEDLFFFDTNTGGLPPTISGQLYDDELKNETQHETSVWHDSDDDRVVVSLASNPRLRKLRDTEDDDIIPGNEYIRRLRLQYERLHPTPKWVEYARKKRRLSNNRHANTYSDSDSDISLDDDDIASSVQPLAEILRSTMALTRTEDNQGKRRNRKLRPEVIDIQRTKDVASSGPSSVEILQFHPYYPLLLSAGPSSTISLHHISPIPPNPNPLLTSLHIKGTPLHTASFCNSTSTSISSEHDRTRIFLSSRRRYFHTWALSTGTVSKISRTLFGEMRKEQKTMESFKISPCGRYMGLVGSARKGGGSINILSTETMQWICSCRVNSQGGVADFAWWSNGNGFSAIGKNGNVSEYDIASRKVSESWKDEGSVGTTTIALGGNNGPKELGESRWVAVGSSSGIVNIYDRRDWSSNPTTLGVGSEQNPKPARVLDQLTTPISHVEFSLDGQMLVIASRWKKNALRLVHLPSCTVYRNWPTEKTALGRISAIALSPDGSYLAVGTEQGKTKLWEIRE